MFGICVSSREPPQIFSTGLVWIQVGVSDVETERRPADFRPSPPGQRLSGGLRHQSHRPSLLPVVSRHSAYFTILDCTIGEYAITYIIKESLIFTLVRVFIRTPFLSGTKHPPRP